VTADPKSGQAPFVFSPRADLTFLPEAAREHEVNLHGGFAVDGRAGFGQIYYGMPGFGVMRVAADLRRQDVIQLPDDLRPLNFHSTKLGQFDGQVRLFMPANSAEKVVVLTLEGKVDFVLPRPVFEQYQNKEAPYNPTDTVLVDHELYIADGYGSNYISSANVHTHDWTGIFGGRTEDPTENGKFLTAHGINFNPVHHHLDIADRPHSRIQNHAEDGRFIASHKLPAGAFLCGINYIQYQDHWYAVIGCLRDPQTDRPAPIYIIDAESYELLSTIRPKEELGIELAQHLHNVVFHIHEGQLYLICQAWNPGHYFVLQKI
jgi:hypothetical protein